VQLLYKKYKKAEYCFFAEGLRDGRQVAHSHNNQRAIVARTTAKQPEPSMPKVPMPIAPKCFLHKNNHYAY
jgi:hypothetical protein